MKKIILLAIACIAASNAFSQRFMFGLGFGSSIDHTASKSVTSLGMTVNARYNVIETDKMSISIGIPFTFGGSGSGSGKVEETYYDIDGNLVTYYTDEDKKGPLTKNRAMIDVPLVVNYSYGAFSTLHNKNAVGFFVGGGLAYHYGPVNIKHKAANGGNYTDSTMQHSIGPIVNAGMRIGLGKRKNGAIEVKGSYMKGLNKRQPDIYGITLLYIFPVIKWRADPNEVD